MSTSSPNPSLLERQLRYERFSRRGLRMIFNVMIVVAAGIGFGKIASVDNVPDRAVQNLRLSQIPGTLEKKAKELRDKGASEEDVQKELARVGESLVKDAMKARPTLSANDRSRWATIRALVEKDAKVYRYAPVFNEAQRKTRIEELAAVDPDNLAKFRYLPHELLRNCKEECPEKYQKSRVQDGQWEKRVVPYAIDRVWETPGWDSIDVVKHGLDDEVWDPSNPASGYIYSSKPPLLPTVMAIPYWILNRCFGLSLATRPFDGVKILLVIYNLIPLIIAFCCLASILLTLGTFSNTSRIFALATGLFATFALTFVATLNNHIPGFVCIVIALWAAFKITVPKPVESIDEFKSDSIVLPKPEGKLRYFALAGFFGAFAVACELPALAFAGLLCLWLLVKHPAKTLFVSIPAGLLVVAAFFGTNYAAHQTFIPAYAHKRDHMALQEKLRDAEESTGAEDAEADTTEKASLFDSKDWYVYNYYPAGRPREFKYARLSHWASRTGIDKGEPSIKKYAFHSTIGLRGVFSLAPVCLLGLLGALGFMFERKPSPYGYCAPQTESEELNSKQKEAYTESEAADEYLAEVRQSSLSCSRAFGVIAVVVAAVFFAFFLTRDQGDRNYGGISCFPRWFFPIMPLCTICVMGFFEKIKENSVLRWIAYACLFWSVANAFYPTWTPWTDPSLYHFAVDWNLFAPY